MEQTVSKESVNNLLEAIDGEQTNSRPAPAKIKVLIVDDEEIMRDLLGDILGDEGYKVFTASSGFEALQFVEKEAVEIIISDIMMPGISGLEMLVKAKKIDPLLDVIVMTGYASIESAVESMKAGATDYLTKPLNVDHVRIVVKKIVNKRVLELKAEESEYYKKLSQLDGLTELFNHRYFQQLLDIEIARSRRSQRPLALIILDVDDFKIFNDVNGHPSGDMILKKLSWLLKKHFRDCDFVARYGGEEFATILPDTDKTKGIAIAKRICQVVNETPFEQENALPRGKLTISLGLAAYPEDAQTRKELVEYADIALYQAKKNGKNQVCAWSGTITPDR